ncbi:MAG: class I SAM-dependent methyltransferase [Elusimicrobiales bacterium]|nr:class I SAM-dependent methyltransferase [Elusimicrobiales bacterium]
MSLAKKWVKAGEEGLRNHYAVMRLLGRIQAASLLDVGCARGQKTRAYAQALGVPLSAVKGVEPQAHYAAEAEKDFGVYRVNIEMDRFPVADNSFDLVICNQVLEHLKNIFLPLSEMDRVVKPGGFLLIGVPNMAGLYNRLLLLAGLQPLANAIDGPHVRGFAHASFVRFLRQNGNFELAAVDCSNLYPLPYPFLSLLGGHFPGLSCFTFYLLKKRMQPPVACGWKAGPAEDTVFN